MAKLEVSTHSGTETDILEVEDYNPVEIEKKRNDDSLLSILLGNNSYSRIDLKNIKVIEEIVE